jgi:hypothetical protein
MEESNPDHLKILERQKVLMGLLIEKKHFKKLYWADIIHAINRKKSIGAIKAQKSQEISQKKDKEFKELILQCFDMQQVFGQSSAISMRKMLETINEIIKNSSDSFLNIAPEGSVSWALLSKRLKNNTDFSRTTIVVPGTKNPIFAYYRKDGSQSGLIPQTPEIPSVEQGQQPPSSAPAVLIATQPVVPEVNLGAGWSAAPKEQTETTAAAAKQQQRER